MNSLIQSIASVPFFQTAGFGISALVVVGSSWSLTGLVMGDAPKKGVNPGLVQLLSALVATIVSVAVVFGADLVPRCSAKVLFLTCGTYAMAGAINYVMLQIMSYAMQRGPNGIIWTIIQSALIFPFLGGVVFFHVRLNAFRISGILLLLAALVLFGFGKDNSPRSGGGNWKIAAFICLALCAVQQNLTTAPSYFAEARAVNSVVRSLSNAAGILFAAVLELGIRMNGNLRTQIWRNLKSAALWKYVCALQFFGLVFAYTLFYPGMNAMADAGLGGMCFPVLVGSCIVAFMLASVCFLKERLCPLHLAALAICISGLVFICFP